MQLVGIQIYNVYKGHSSKISGIDRTLTVFLRGAQTELQKQAWLGRSNDTAVTGLVMVQSQPSPLTFKINDVTVRPNI